LVEKPGCLVFTTMTLKCSFRFLRAQSSRSKKTIHPSIGLSWPLLLVSSTKYVKF
jgi:hypothetical protein